MSNRPQALFLDRDGTLIEWVDYLHDPSKVVLTEGVAQSLKSVKNAGCRLFLHTNQSGVGRGFFTLDEVHAVNEEMVRLMGLRMDVFDEICIAVDHPEKAGPDSYRKPSSRFEDEMVAAFCLEREHCYVIGDGRCDVDTGRAARMNAVGIRNTKRKAVDFGSDAAVFSSVAEFVGKLRF